MFGSTLRLGAICAALIAVTSHPVLAQAKDDVTAQIASQIPNNGRGQITAAGLRGVLNAINALTLDPQPAGRKAVEQGDASDLVLNPAAGGLPVASFSQVLTGKSPLYNLQLVGAPSVSVAPIGNPITTLTGLDVRSTTVSDTAREFGTTLGMNSSKGASQSDVSGNGDKVTLYTGMIQMPGSGNAWSYNTLVERRPGVTKSTLGYELDFNNNDQHLGEALGEAGLARPFGYGLTITGAAPFRSTAAIEIGGPGVSQLWNRGVVISQNSVKQASFQDLTVSDISLDVRGGHQYPIDLANSGVVKGAIRLPLQQSIVAGNPDSNGARDDSGNVQLIGTDANKNVRIASTGGALAIFGSTLVPASTTQDVGSSTTPFRNAYLNGLNLTPYGPPSSSTPCATGTISADTAYLYVCVSSNKWRRTALVDF